MEEFKRVIGNVQVAFQSNESYCNSLPSMSPTDSSSKNKKSAKITTSSLNNKTSYFLTVTPILTSNTPTRIKPSLRFEFDSTGKIIDKVTSSEGSEKILQYYSSELDQALPFHLKKSLNLTTPKPKLSDYFSEEFVNYLTNMVSFDINSVVSSSIPSFNKVYFTKDSSGKEYVLKVTSNRSKAENELNVLNAFSANDILSKYFTVAKLDKPIELQDNLYLTIQEKISFANSAPLDVYVDALSSLHLFGKDVLRENGFSLSKTWTPKEFAQLKDHVKPLLSSNVLRNLSGIYQDALDNYNFVLIDDLEVTHTDPKPDNLYSGKLIDTESVQLANPIVGLSLLLASSGISVVGWRSLVDIYNQNLSIGSKKTVDLNDVYSVALLTASKELAGLQSRAETFCSVQQKISLTKTVDDLVCLYVR